MGDGCLTKSSVQVSSVLSPPPSVCAPPSCEPSPRVVKTPLTCVQLLVDNFRLLRYAETNYGSCNVLAPPALARSPSL